MENNETTTEEIIVKANDSIDELAIFIKPSDYKAVGQDLRIEETVYRTWSGVRGCGDSNEIARQVKAAYEGWVARKLFEYRHLKYKSYGHGEGKVRTSSGKRPWPDNSRFCGGSLSLPCYIIFEQD
ncbi:MAG: hypothetical protein RBS55_09615 [Bacteroidales bacterium]|jgi:hypothetical protein|nr:hypothetical protein [Bacteroidales bacterium]